MIVELINTGSELMLGRVLNTHQQWLCRKLADLGYVVSRQVAVPDTAQAIQASVQEALQRADLVITTGGLGPTSDDLTRDLIACLLGRRLHEDRDVLEGITRFFEARKRPMPARTRVQALVPESALVLPNRYGTAPGLAMKVQPNPFRESGNSSWLVMLPGPPRELRPMFGDSVVPLLQRELPLRDVFLCRTLRACGIGESVVEEKVAPPLEALVAEGLELGYCARPGQVDVRLAARGKEAQRIVAAAEAIVRQQLDHFLYGTEEEELEHVIVRLLTEKKRSLALAESCTGGRIADRITDVPGASKVLRAAYVTYSNEAKQTTLGVSSDVLSQHGAVSEAVARQMAEGARIAAGADYGLSVTGIAGPDGGTPEKPVGTVFLGLAGPFPTLVLRQLNPWDRETFKFVTSQQALDLLRRKVQESA